MKLQDMAPIIMGVCDVHPSQETAMSAKVRHYRRLGFPSYCRGKRGRGHAHDYSTEEAFAICVGLSSGYLPHDVIRIILPRLPSMIRSAKAGRPFVMKQVSCLGLHDNPHKRAPHAWSIFPVHVVWRRLSDLWPAEEVAVAA